MLRPVALPSAVPGGLYLHSMPGRYETWPEARAEIEACGIGTVVCLAPREEVRRKSPSYAAVMEAGMPGFELLEFPIEDFAAPDDRVDFGALALRIADSLRGGGRTLIHCAGGVGRTGTLAACVLIELFVSRDRALEAVGDAGAGPENESQRRFVRAFARSRRSEKRCSLCGGRPAAPVAYGFPTDELLESADRGDVVPGSCVVLGSEIQPEYLCERCSGSRQDR